MATNQNEREATILVPKREYRDLGERLRDPPNDYLVLKKTHTQQKTGKLVTYLLRPVTNTHPSPILFIIHVHISNTLPTFQLPPLDHTITICYRNQFTVWLLEDQRDWRMRDRLERCVLLPFSLGCISESSVVVRRPDCHSKRASEPQHSPYHITTHTSLFLFLSISLRESVSCLKILVLWYFACRKQRREGEIWGGRRRGRWRWAVTAQVSETP